MTTTLPTVPNADRDWELTCDNCDGDGFVYVERRVGPCQTDIQTFKEECECCEGRGFVFAFEDIPRHRGVREVVPTRHCSAWGCAGRAPGGRLPPLRR